ncbi:MAG: PhzF family phenazine biosynthesis protein [Bacteroidales bacterium]|nr:PhzF family phenazine biosynthesis protein [Bacteroidales bacterium]
MRYFIADAFAEHPFGGNTAGVVLAEDGTFPDAGVMQSIAAELRYSETAFVRQESNTTWHLRYFTPTGEVELCGHATVATFALLHQLGLAEGKCLCKTKAGLLNVVVGEHVMLQTATPDIIHTLTTEETADAYRALNLSPLSPTLSNLRPQVVSTGLPDIMLPLPSVATLNTLRPDMGAIAALTAHLGAVSLHPFALGNDSHTAHVRDFAPSCGIPEESATGTANASLTHYLHTHSLLTLGAECSFLQGEAMGRPSVVYTHLAPDGNVWVGGPAFIVAEGVLRI